MAQALSPAWTGDAARPAAAARRPRDALLALLAIALAVQFVWPLATLPLHVSYNNNEGWNAYWSTRALAHQPLYTDAASPITNNYPPLSFYLVGYAGRAIGDLVIAGRLICLASLLACAAMVRAAVARFGGERGWATLAGGIFLLYVATFAWRYVAADDPQWLAQAFMLAGLLLLLEPAPVPPRAGRIAGACLLMLLGGLVKHSQLALPIAVTLWLAIHDRRGLAVWLATAIVGGGIALAVMAWAFGPALFDQVLHHQRTFNPRFLRSSLGSLAPLLPEMALTVLLVRARPRRDPRLTLLFAFAALALVIGIVERSGAGVSQNAHFDSAIALAILAGVALAQGAGMLGEGRAKTVALAAMLLPMLAVVPHRTMTLTRQLAALPETNAGWGRAIAFLASRPGPVACERLALCYWSGKPQALDFFNYGQKIKRGGDPIGLARLIDRRRFGGLVVLKDDRYRTGDARLPPDYYRLIEARYRVVRTLPDNLYVLAPKG